MRSLFVGVRGEVEGTLPDKDLERLLIRHARQSWSVAFFYVFLISEGVRALQSGAESR